jgi:hypothetical protein
MNRRRLVGARKGSGLDLGTVYAYADAFAKALTEHDVDVVGNSLHPDSERQVPEEIAGYLGEDPSITGVLQMLPRPIEKAEVLSVSLPLGSDRCISLIRLSGSGEEVRLQAVWRESGTQPLIESAQIVEPRSR